MRSQKRLLIVEEALANLETGHWYEHIKTVAGACRSAGHDVVIAAHRRASQQVLDSLQALPIIPVSAWEPRRGTSNALRRYFAVLRHNMLFYRTMANFLGRQRQPFDCVFAPTVLIHQLIAWRWLARRFAGKAFRYCVLFFLNPPGLRMGPGGSLVFPRSTRLMRRVLAELAPDVVAGRVRLAAETRRVAENFKAFCGMDLEVIPQPVALDTLEAQPKAGKPLFACYGFARYEKGSDLLQEALLRLLEAENALPARFLVQWRGAFRDGNGRMVEPAPRLRECGDVEFVERAFDTAEYMEHLAGTDAMVLPYRRDSYYDRDSRVAIEAAVLGIPTVYTRDTWLDQCAQSCGAGIPFENGNSADLARAIVEMIHVLPQQQARARAKAATARAYFSPDRFEKWLMNGPELSRDLIDF